MSLPSSPSHYDTASLNGNDYQFDSDLQAWLLKRSATDKQIESSLDSDVTFLRSLFNLGAQSAGFPVGSVVPFAVSNLPKGFLLADGSSFNTLLYPDLYAYLDSDRLPDYTNRTFGFKVYDYDATSNDDKVVFAIAGYNGAGLTTDSDVINAVVEQQTANLQSQINILEEDLAQAIADRVFTDNTLSARIDGHDSDLDTKGRFYVQATAPSGGPNSGWVNTTNMKLHVFDTTTDTWIEVTLT